MLKKLEGVLMVMSLVFILLAVAFTIVIALWSFVLWDNWFSNIEFVLTMVRTTFVLAVFGTAGMIAYDYKGFKEASE